MPNQTTMPPLEAETPETRAQSQNPGAESQSSPKESKKRKKKKKPGALSDLFTLLLKIAWIAVIFFALMMFVFGVIVNTGARMEPSFQDQDIVVYYRLAKDMTAGETVVYRNSYGAKVTGRIVAVGGDTVEIDERGLKVNGYYQADEHAVGETVLFEQGVIFPVTLSAGQYFILCDDRSQEDDSRTLGPLTEAQIEGRIMLLLRHREF